MNRVIMVLALALVLYGTVPAGAEETSLGMKEAVGLAMENNHEIKAFMNSVFAQKEDIGIARSSLLPKIAFEERFMRTNNPTFAFMAKLNQQRFTQQDFAIESLNNPSPVTDYQTSFSFEQPVFAKKAYIGLDMARTESGAKDEDFKRKKQEIAMKVAETYLMVLTAREYVSVAEKGVEDAREHLRIAELKQNTGLGLYSDSLRASTAVTEAEQKSISARKNLDVLKRALGLLLGTTESVGAADEDPGLVLRDITYYDAAAATREDIKSLELRHENAKNNLRLVEASYLPVVGVGGSYQLNDHRRPAGSEGESWQVAAFLRWDIFDGTKRSHDKTKAYYQISEAEEYLKGMKKAVSFRVYEAYLGAEEALKKKELSQSALTTAEEGKRLVKKRYESALSPIVDLLDTQVSLDHARANAVASQNEYRRAVIAVAYESGTILQELGIEER